MEVDHGRWLRSSRLEEEVIWSKKQSSDCASSTALLVVIPRSTMKGTAYSSELLEGLESSPSLSKTTSRGGVDWSLLMLGYGARRELEASGRRVRSWDGPSYG